jgi:hypothetical protein
MGVTPYLLCQTKGCASYGKSIRRDQMEGEFETPLAGMRPAQAMYDRAIELFRDLWDARVAASHSDRAQLHAEVKLLEQQIEQLVDRIMKTESPAAMTAYENRLAALETQQGENRRYDCQMRASVGGFRHGTWNRSRVSRKPF